jgi:3-deoxy-manno-octulosonate cytidylyltransferase (CMP-KDO synthetase)
MGSSRLPGKVLADIGGAPMVVQVWRRAMEAGVGPVVVACCEQEVADAVTAAGGAAVLTDPALASGSDRVWAALCAVDAAGLHDVVVNLQGDLPAIGADAVSAVVQVLADKQFDIGTLVAEITSPEEARAPSVVKCACAFTGGRDVTGALYFSRREIPAGDGPLWHHVGIYAYRRPALAQFISLPESALERREKLEQLRALEAGLRIGVRRIAEAPFGVDTPADLARAREMFR